MFSLLKEYFIINNLFYFYLIPVFKHKKSVANIKNMIYIGLIHEDRTVSVRLIF